MRWSHFCTKSVAPLSTKITTTCCFRPLLQPICCNNCLRSGKKGVQQFETATCYILCPHLQPILCTQGSCSGPTYLEKASGVGVFRRFLDQLLPKVRGFCKLAEKCKKRSLVAQSCCTGSKRARCDKNYRAQKCHEHLCNQFLHPFIDPWKHVLALP